MAAAPSRRTLLFLATLMVAGAINLGYAGFTRSPKLHVPPAIGYLVALIMIATAARLLEMATGRAERGDWFALVFFGASAVIQWWIALFSTRGCGSSIGGLSVVTSGGGGPCRVGFGIAAGICTALAIFCSYRLLRLKT
ncbi:MAG TPA: hypothetical protein VK481_10300 [Gemmatimonadaceae bacterium]|nr:hypothetical protein [Gemmatimonadaceae bacterium]